MFEALIVKPIFNLLVLIYAWLPGHNFGLALIIFTIIIRLLMWPLVKKQLYHAKAIRKLQPELKRIKKEAKGDRQKESLMTMALYKEREISPFGSIGVLVIQLVILLGLYSGLNRVVQDPQAVVDFSYGLLQNLGWLESLANDIHKFDATLLGAVDLTKSALNPWGIYWPAMALVFGSAAIQYLQSSQLMPTDKDSRKLRQILKEASSGKQADQAEVNAAVGRSTRYFIPIMIFLFTVNLPSALSLYWFVSGLVAYIQQAMILDKDEEELQEVASKPDKGEIIEGEVIDKASRPTQAQKPKTKPKTTKKKKSPNKSKKRRR